MNMNNDQIDLIQLVQKLLQFPILNVVYQMYSQITSLLLDACFLGYQICKKQSDQKEIAKIIEMISELNNELQVQTQTLEEKASLYHILINYKEASPNIKELKSQIITSKIFPQQSQIIKSVIISNNCSICYDQMSLKRLFTLTNCPHIFHKNCLIELVKSKSELPIICPQAGCLKEILQVDLRELSDRETLQKLDQFSFNNYLTQNAEKLFHCPTQGCNVVVEQIDDKFICPICQKAYCRKCRQPFHEGQCGEDQFMQLAKEKKLKQCRQCKQWVEKNQGCRHMTCRCLHQFCYVCGEDWGKCICKK